MTMTLEAATGDWKIGHRSAAASSTTSSSRSSPTTSMRSSRAGTCTRCRTAWAASGPWARSGTTTSPTATPTTTSATAPTTPSSGPLVKPSARSRQGRSGPALGARRRSRTRCSPTTCAAAGTTCARTGSLDVAKLEQRIDAFVNHLMTAPWRGTPAKWTNFGQVRLAEQLRGRQLGRRDQVPEVLDPHAPVLGGQDPARHVRRDAHTRRRSPQWRTAQTRRSAARSRCGVAKGAGPPHRLRRHPRRARPADLILPAAP